MSRRIAAIDDLRTTVECLPRHTRVAMLEAIRHESIIVGAYTDQDGGVCPMLGAHRYGGRTSFLAFAKSWDRFTAAPGRGRSRPATRRELSVLERFLVRSLQAEVMQPTDLDPTAVTASELGRVIVEHRELVERHRPERPVRTVDETVSLADAIAAHQELQARSQAEQPVAEPVPEITARRSRGGRVRMPDWMRPLDTVADYEAAMAEVDRQRVRLGLVGDTAGPAPDDAPRSDRAPERESLNV